jgi:hypothetical protein
MSVEANTGTASVPVGPRELAREVADLMAAEDIGQASHEGGCVQPLLYAEPLERFDRIRALLDLIGWKDETDERPAILNLVAHRPALLAALETERNSSEDDSSLEGAEKQIACARRRVADLEQFLGLASLSLGGSA